MATINTIQDLLRLLDENPEWVDALRARLLTQELLELPERFSQFAEGVNTFVLEMTEFKTTVERFIETTNQFIEATNKRFDALEAGQARLEADMSSFRDRVDRFVDATDRHFKENTTQHAQFDADMKVLRSDIGVLRGSHARTTAIRKAAGIARVMGLRRTRNLSMDDLYDMIDSADTSDIHANVLTSFANADLVMEAKNSGGEMCYVAAEISYTVHDRDVSRASRNSRFLTRFTGRPAFAAVSSESIDEDIQDIIDSGEVFWYQLTSEDLEVD